MKPGVSALQREIRQNRPFQSPADECLLGLVRTVDGLKTRVMRLFKASGITLQQYNVLRILRGAGTEGLPTLEIAERMVEHAPGITRLLERLERKRLVKRERSVPDKRRIVCWITQKGLDLVGSLDAPVIGNNQESLRMLSEEEVRTLIQLLDRVREGFDGAQGQDT